ncbi:serine/threonine dehydratase [Aureimonas endophytica]|uniref:Serine/threonine dehydratase n=1 Tax=Aureimonas endophytica TaxID=2027858 RepID=A0A916ZM26_9HYPH|nr:threonine/serine dehydratase [Aureimonas endophytica]GGE04097.1 serine/threonine dehydratase [Aureimonas endophytica]
MIALSDIEAAARRIAPHIRRTPLLAATALREPVSTAELFLKLECLQPTGSFKVRGATNRLLLTPAEDLPRGLATASGGNHGLAVARSGALAGVPATIFVPRTISAEKLAKLRDWGATVRLEGAVWDEANVAARAFAAETGAVYIHPFGDTSVIAGQGTVALEILEALPDLDVILVAIGGGGLVAGIASVLKALKPAVRIVGIEPVGSPTLRASLEKGAVTRLDAVTTRVATMACGKTEEIVFEIARGAISEIVLVEDEEMLEAARWLWREMGLAADLSGAAALAAIRSGRLDLPPGAKVCALVCGAGSEGIQA